MNIKNEEPKRLDIKISDIRKLYAKSGNICAFPGCNQFFYDDNSTQNLSNICHIEAAEAGGQRFNPNQTNEDRRHYDNLILLCPNHHKITDDVKEYTVETLKNMKYEHEKLIVKKIKAIEDVYTNSSVIYSVISCISESINDILSQETLDSTNALPFSIEEKIDYNLIVKYKHVFHEHSIFQGKINQVYEELETNGTQSNAKILLTRKIRSLYLKLTEEFSNPDLIIDKIKNDIIISDLKNCDLNNEIIDISLDIIIVDIFMRCKIFSPPPNPQGN